MKMECFHTKIQFFFLKKVKKNSFCIKILKLNLNFKSWIRIQCGSGSETLLGQQILCSKFTSLWSGHKFFSDSQTLIVVSGSFADPTLLPYEIQDFSPEVRYRTKYQHTSMYRYCTIPVRYQQLFYFSSSKFSLKFWPFMD